MSAPLFLPLFSRIIRRLTKGLVVGYAAFLTVYFLLRFLFWDEFWPVGLVGTFIPWIFLPLLILPAASFFIIRERKWTVLSVLACLLLLGWGHQNYTSPNPSQINSNPLIILSLNNSWDKTSSETLVELIFNRNPDLVFLQEVTERHEQKALPRLTDAYPYQFSSPRTAILSKFPLGSTETLHLANHSEFQQRATATVDRQEITLYNIQTISPWIRFQEILPGVKIPFYDYRQRSEEIMDLVERIRKEKNPVIVAGDFNLTDQTQDYHRLRQVLRDAFRESGWGLGLTWPHGWPLNFLIKNSTQTLDYPLFRIDYIWYSPGGKSKITNVLPSTGSDHLPVETQLDFPRSAARNSRNWYNLIGQG